MMRKSENTKKAIPHVHGVASAEREGFLHLSLTPGPSNDGDYFTDQDPSSKPCGGPDAKTPLSGPMDDRNKVVVAHGKVDPRKTTTPSTTKERRKKMENTSSVSQPGQSPTCPTCNRTFASYRGRRLHERRAHAEAFHAEAQKIDGQKRRIQWSHEEDLLLAQAEVNFTGASSSQSGKAQIYNHLQSLFPHRTRDAIKARLLKSDKYRAIRQQVLDQQSTPPTVDDDENLNSTEHQVLQSWTEVLKKAIEEEKLTPAYTCNNSNRTDRQFAKWLKKKVVVAKKKKNIARKPPPKITGNRANRRRKLRAAWLSAFERNPSRTAKLILDGKELHQQAKIPEGTTQFWKELFTQESVGWSGSDEESTMKETTKHQSLLDPFTTEEITSHLKKMRAGATGTDAIKLADVRRLPRKELTEWFNLFLLQGHVPKLLKRFRTTLIPKNSDPSKPSEFRPISVGSFVRRLFTGMLAKRLQTVETHHCQRGFKKIEGCAIQSLTLRALVDEYINKPASLHYCFMDVRKAFDSVSHHALRKAYVKADLPAGIIRLFEDMYIGNTTVLSTDPDQSIVRLNRGVLQGDPLSPILFNLVMDDVVAGLDPNIGADLGEAKINCLMFADDSVLIANTQMGLQEHVNTYVDRMATYGLELNVSKCAAVHIKADKKRKKWYVAPNIPLYAGGVKVKALTIGESYRYLGLTTNVNRGLTNAHHQLKSQLNRLSTSVLKPQQRLSVLKTNVIPGLLFETTLEHRSEAMLKDLDISIRKEVRRWLHLPKDIPTPMFHTSVKDGGLGIPSLRTRVPRLSWDRLLRTEKLLDPDDWLKALIASPYWRKMKERTSDSLARVGVSDKTTENHHWRNGLYISVDGSGLRNHGNSSGFGSQWIQPSFLQLSGREFVGAMHIRCNSLITRERATRGRMTNKGRNCPCCPDKRESLAHILQVCWRSQNLRIFRHNHIVGMILNKLRKLQFKVNLEPRIPHGNTFLKPDIVAAKGETVYILDPSIVACSRDLVRAESDKTQKYSISSVLRWAKRKYGSKEVIVAGVIVDWRGAWAPRTVDILRQLGIPKGFVELISFKILKLNRWIYQCVRDRTDT